MIVIDWARLLDFKPGRAPAVLVSCRICRRELRTAHGLCTHFTRMHRPRATYQPMSARQDQLMPRGMPG